MVGVPRFSGDLACKISQNREKEFVYNEEVVCFQLCSSALQTSYNTFPGTLSSCFVENYKKIAFLGAPKVVCILIHCVIVGVGIKGENEAITTCHWRQKLWLSGRIWVFAIFPIGSILESRKMGFLRFLKQDSFATQGVEVGFMVFETIVL